MSKYVDTLYKKIYLFYREIAMNIKHKMHRENINSRPVRRLLSHISVQHFSHTQTTGTCIL